MNGSKLIDEINRLFDQLVRDPWTRVPHRPSRLRGGETEIELILPLEPGQRADVAVALEGRRLTVRAQRPGAHGGAPVTLAEKVITVPEGAEVSGLEAQFEGARLHVRVHLHTSPVEP